MSDPTPSATPPDSSRTLELRVPEMDCPSCAGKVTNSVDRLAGIDSIDPQVTSGRLVVAYDPALTTSDEIRDRVRAAGYSVESPAAELSVSVPGMDCASCASKVENALAATAGVDDIETRPASGRVTVVAAESTDAEAVIDAIESAGYDAEPIDDGAATIGDKRAVWRSRRAIGTAIGGLLVAVGLALQFVVPASNPELFVALDRSYAASVVPNAFGGRFYEPGPGRRLYLGMEGGLGPR